MANRFVLKQFAGSATNNGAFGAAQATGAGVQPVANIEDVQSLAAFEQGWNSATLTADKLPPLEEMQGLEAILCKAIKENYSEGIPFWIAGETYYQNSRAVYNGKIYRNTTGSYTANNPATDTTNWELDKPDFAGIADKLGSSTVGSPSQGIYLVDGVPTPVTAVTGANVDLDNLTATGEAHFANPALTNLSEGLKNTICTTAAGTTSTASSAVPAVVVENYQDVVNWYRVWSDGWIEQGGYVSATTAAVNQTINFNKAFTTTNYFAVAALAAASTVDLGSYQTDVFTKTTTSFKTVHSANKYWYACGY